MSPIARMNETYSLLSWLYFGTKVVGGLLLGATILLYANQDKLLYFPNPPNIPKNPDENPYGCSSPGEWGKNGKILNSRNGRSLPIPFEDHMVSTDDGEKIHTWLMLQDDSEDRPTLIYFHGNAANMGFRLQNAAEMYAKAKINILMMDYRGFGKSSGVPNEKGLQLDGEAVLKYAKNHPRLKNSPIVVFGRSLGGAVSFYLAEKFPSLVAAVIVENTFMSISAMVDIIMPFLRPIKPYVLRINWASDEKIPRVKQPILFISGDSDQLVPPFHMKALYDLATQSSHKDFFTVLGGTHNDTWERGGERYYVKLRDFLSSLFESSSATRETQQPIAISPASVVGDSETTTCDATDNQANQNDGQGNVSQDATINDDEDDDYMVVEPPVSAIPTMNSNFQVR